MPKWGYSVVDGEGFRYGQIVTCEAEPSKELLDKRLETFVNDVNIRRKKFGTAPEIDIKLCKIENMTEIKS